MRTAAPGNILLALAVFAAAAENLPAAVVRVERADGGYRLLRDGAAYFVRGAAGCNTGALMDELVAAGGNSVRLWNAREDLREVFDLAQARGLTVCPTLWLGRDNNTAAARAENYTAARVQALVAEAHAAVLRFKDHPALLVWGVGNEMEAPGNGSPELWQAVDQIAAMVHAVDPGHPACLGSYVFVWRQSEGCSAFHDCFTPAGERLQHVETMSQAWTGRPVKNRAPRIDVTSLFRAT